MELPPPFAPLTELNAAKPWAQQYSQIVNILHCLTALRDYYRSATFTFREQGQEFNAYRWVVTGITKVRRKDTFDFKHESMIIHVQCGNLIRHVPLERTKDKWAVPGISLWDAIDQAEFFRTANPADTGEYNILSTIRWPYVLTAGQPERRLSLPDILVITYCIHRIEPHYQIFGANCYWFADALSKILLRHDYVVENAASTVYGWITHFLFDGSIATEEQIVDIDNRFLIQKENYFDFNSSWPQLKGNQ